MTNRTLKVTLKEIILQIRCSYGGIPIRHEESRLLEGPYR